MLEGLLVYIQRKSFNDIYFKTCWVLCTLLHCTTHHFKLQFLYFFGELVCLRLDLFNGGLHGDGEGRGVRGRRKTEAKLGHWGWWWKRNGGQSRLDTTVMNTGWGIVTLWPSVRLRWCVAIITGYNANLTRSVKLIPGQEDRSPIHSNLWSRLQSSNKQQLSVALLSLFVGWLGRWSLVATSRTSVPLARDQF